MGWRFPHCTRPLGFASLRAVATRTRRGTTVRLLTIHPIVGILGITLKSNSCRPVSNCLAAKRIPGGPVRLPDNTTEWRTATTASHSNRDTSGALRAASCGRCMGAFGGHWILAVNPGWPRWRTWAAVRRVPFQGRKPTQLRVKSPGTKVSDRQSTIIDHPSARIKSPIRGYEAKPFRMKREATHQDRPWPRDSRDLVPISA
ncbi:hypothetical protein N657DRAFT_641722 [Parathielavia appendiculata]|uniref:Uncharacterized protein n=1 Tax=Parathielavia appendiculata TaxID=2587402 RepID=A0AAN6U7A2_9PEZI|nr:hypothetical protein N657DRAFT_641722 [Parathielavia appendiculata]